MKKYFFALPLVLMLASCKKDHTCQCTVGGDVVHSTTTIKDTKKNATETCNEKDNGEQSIECSIIER